MIYGFVSLIMLTLTSMSLGYAEDVRRLSAGPEGGNSIRLISLGSNHGIYGALLGTDVSGAWMPWYIGQYGSDEIGSIPRKDGVLAVLQSTGGFVSLSLVASGQWQNGRDIPRGPKLKRYGIILNGDGRLEILALADDGTAWHAWEVTPGGEWSQWDSLGGQKLMEMTTSQNADGRAELFAIGGDRTLYHTKQTLPGGGPWTGWTSLGGVQLKNIAATSASDGSIELFALGGDSSIWNIRQVVRNGNWGAWASLGGSQLSAVAAMPNADGRIEVFAVGGGGSMWHKWQNTGGRWGEWSRLTPAGNKPLDQFAISRKNSGELFLATTASGTACWTSQTQPNGDWTNWSCLAEPKPPQPQPTPDPPTPTQPSLIASFCFVASVGTGFFDLSVTFTGTGPGGSTFPAKTESDHIAVSGLTQCITTRLFNLKPGAWSITASPNGIAAGATCPVTIPGIVRIDRSTGSRLCS